MSKGGKTAGKREGAADDSLLGAAWAALERGDVVQGRRLAQAALAGKTKGDEAATARRLAKDLSREGAPMGESVAEVAKGLLDKSALVAKPFIFAGVAVGTWVLLLLLYGFRYAVS